MPWLPIADMLQLDVVHCIRRDLVHYGLRPMRPTRVAGTPTNMAAPR
jgi:hypothetical protein